MPAVPEPDMGQPEATEVHTDAAVVRHTLVEWCLPQQKLAARGLAQHQVLLLADARWVLSATVEFCSQRAGLAPKQVAAHRSMHELREACLRTDAGLCNGSSDLQDSNAPCCSPCRKHLSQQLRRMTERRRSRLQLSRLHLAHCSACRRRVKQAWCATRAGRS